MGDEKEQDGAGAPQSGLEGDIQSQSSPSTGISITSPSDGFRKTSDDEDKDPAENRKSVHQPFDSCTKPNYPQWLQDLNNLASAKGVKLFFSNNDVIDVKTAFPSYALWADNIPGVVTSAYRCADIPNNELSNTLTSFLTYGVEVSRDNR